MPVQSEGVQKRNRPFKTGDLAHGQPFVDRQRRECKVNKSLGYSEFRRPSGPDRAAEERQRPHVEIID